MSSAVSGGKVAIVIPCYNEALTIAKVVTDFRRVVPDAQVYVFDNASTDGSAALAMKAGASVVFVPQPGKGHVVQAIFERLDADAVVIVDGDDTYPADMVHDLIRPVIAEGVDMSVGTRLKEFDDRARGGSFRPLHVIGNRFIVSMINILFGVKLNDVLSGYRVFGRRFMLSMPVLSKGFEIETELTVHAIAHGYAIREVPVRYGVRPEGSVSKLSTWRDGLRIIKLVPSLFKDTFPLRFFSTLSVIMMICAGWGMALVWKEFEHHGHVVGVARAAAVVGLGLLAGLLWGIGLILDVMNQRARDAHRLSVQHALRAWHTKAQ